MCACFRDENFAVIGAERMRMRIAIMGGAQDLFIHIHCSCPRIGDQALFILLTKKMVSLAPSNLRRKINSDADLAKIARELTGWTVVRPFSGLSSAEEETIRTNYKDIEDQRFVYLLAVRRYCAFRTTPVTVSSTRTVVLYGSI